jgi:hypothetical protein
MNRDMFSGFTARCRVCTNLELSLHLCISITCNVLPFRFTDVPGSRRLIYPRSIDGYQINGHQIGYAGLTGTS